MVRRTELSFLFVVLMATGTSGAEDKPDFDFKFSHAETPVDVTHSLHKAQGAPIRVLITNTDSSAFTYRITGLEALTMKPAHELRPTTPSDTVLVEQRHDSRFRGYVIRIRQKPNRSSKFDLKELDIVIHVETREWNVEFAGAFSVSGLTNPRYAVADSVVARDEDAEDAVALGVAAFIHTSHTRVPWLAGTFGLGINQSASATYYLGGTFPAGPAAFTVGGVFGSVERLPTGVSEGSRISDPNVLNDLPTKTEGSWFVALSYTFLGNRAAFEKPFLGEQEAAADAKRRPLTPKSETEDPDSE